MISRIIVLRIGLAIAALIGGGASFVVATAAVADCNSCR
jgi:hypothetical protein